MADVGQSYLDATIVTGESVSSMWSTDGGRAREFVARATQWVMIDAMCNARVCSGTKLRLYRKTKARRAKWAGKAITDRKRIEYLRDPTRVGAKAADYADSDMEEVVDHPVLDLLQGPNETDRGGEFSAFRFLMKELTGNAFTLKARDSGTEPVSLYILPSQYVRIVPGRESLVVAYVYGRNNTRPAEYPAEDVSHQRHAMSPFSPYYGVGPMQAVVKDADRFDASTDLSLAMYRNRARPDGIYKVPPETTKDGIDQTEQYIQGKLRGTSKAGQIMVVRGGEFTPLSWTPADLEDAMSRADAAQIIHAAFGVPESFVKLNDANLASSTTGHTQYLRFTIQPRLVQDAGDLTEDLLPDYGIEPGEYWFCYDDVVPEDTRQMADVTGRQVSGGIITIDEARREFGYEPLPDGQGEEPRINGAPIDSIGGSMTLPDGRTVTTGKEPAPVAAPVAIDTSAALEVVQAVVDGKIPHETARAILAASNPGVAPEVIAAIVDPVQVKEPEPAPTPPPPAAGDDPDEEEDDDEPVTPKVVCVSCMHGKELLGSGAAAESVSSTSLERSVRRYFEQMVPGISAVDNVIDLQRLLAASRSVFSELTADDITRMFSHGYNDGVTDLGERKPPDMGNFDIRNERALRFLESHRIQLAQTVSDTVETRLRGVIAAGVEEGLSIPDIQRRMMDEFEDMDKYSAERIARTEVSRAYNSGKLSAWEESKVVEGKKWLLSTAPCELCRAMATAFNEQAASSLRFSIPRGLSVVGDMGTVYKIDYSSISGPPAHPNCTCTVVPVFSEIQT